MSYSFFQRDAIITDHLKGFSMTRYIYRIIAIVIHTRRLLRLTVSPSYHGFFNRMFNIQVHPTSKRKIQVQPRKLLKNLPVFSVAADTPGMKSRENVMLHAELVIFETLIKRALKGFPPTYGVIGTSKLLCIGCHTIIKEAYPEVLNANPPTSLVHSFPFSVLLKLLT